MDNDSKNKIERLAINVLGTCVIIIVAMAVWIQFLNI
jgi:hypothetical protein